MPGLREVIKLLLRGESASLVIVDELDTLNYFIVKLLNQALGPKVTLVIELVRGNPSNILNKILPEALSKRLHVFLLSESL